MSGNLAEWVEQYTANENYPGYLLVAGFHYLCELCRNGANCRPCDLSAGSEDRNDIGQVLRCLLIDDPEQRLPPGTAWPTLGTRCCLDGP